METIKDAAKAVGDKISVCTGLLWLESLSNILFF
jgi:hypothetical protein